MRKNSNIKKNNINVIIINIFLYILLIYPYFRYGLFDKNVFMVFTCIFYIYACYFLIVISIKKQKIQINLLYMLPLIILAIIYFLLIRNSVFKFQTLLKGYTYITYFIVFIIIYNYIKLNKKNIKHLEFLLIIPVLVQCILVYDSISTGVLINILNNLFSYTGLEKFAIGNLLISGRASSTIGYANSFAILIICSMVLVVKKLYKNNKYNVLRILIASFFFHKLSIYSEQDSDGIIHFHDILHIFASKRRRKKRNCFLFYKYCFSRHCTLWNYKQDKQYKQCELFIVAIYTIYCVYQLFN
jgi:hypothetical protein